MKVPQQLSHGCGNTINEKNTIYCEKKLFSVNRMCDKRRNFRVLLCNKTMPVRWKVYVRSNVQILNGNFA